MSQQAHTNMHTSENSSSKRFRRQRRQSHGEVSDAMQGKQHLALDARLASDKQLLRCLERSFLELRQKDLPISEFVEAVTRVFTTYDSSSIQIDIVHGAVGLFRRIDVSGSGTVSWEQLTSFLVDQVGDQSRVLPPEERAGEEYVAQEHEIGAALASRAHLTHISFSSELCCFAALEQGSDVVRILHLSPNAPVGLNQRSVLRHHTAFTPHVCTAVHFIPGTSIVATASLFRGRRQKRPTFWLSFFHLSKPLPLHRMQVTFSVSKIYYSPISNVLYGSGASLIVGWDTRTYQKVSTLKWHTGAVNCLLTFREKLVSASMDGTICFWNTATNERDNILVAHGGGVRQVAVLPDYDTLNIKCCYFLTVGHQKGPRSESLNVSVWDLERGRISDQLVGHTSPIVDVCFQKQNSWSTAAHLSDSGLVMVVSADTKGSVRIWDASTLSCLQVLPSPENWRGKLCSLLLVDLATLAEKRLRVLRQQKLRRLIEEQLNLAEEEQDQRGLEGPFGTTSLSSSSVASSNESELTTESTSSSQEPDIECEEAGRKKTNKKKDDDEDLVIGTSDIFVFATDLRLQVYSRQRVMPESSPVVAVLYSQRFAAVVVVTKYSILVADARTGLWTQSISCAGTCLGLKRESKRATQRVPSLPCTPGAPELTAACLGRNGRIVVVGDDHGHVHTHNLANGSIVKFLKRHVLPTAPTTMFDDKNNNCMGIEHRRVAPANLPIVSLKYSSLDDSILSTSWAGVIHVSDGRRHSTTAGEPSHARGHPTATNPLRRVLITPKQPIAETPSATITVPPSVAMRRATPDCVMIALCPELNLFVTLLRGGFLKHDQCLCLFDFESTRLIGVCDLVPLVLSGSPFISPTQSGKSNTDFFEVPNVSCEQDEVCHNENNEGSEYEEEEQQQAEQQQQDESDDDLDDDEDDDSETGDQKEEEEQQQQGFNKSGKNCSDAKLRSLPGSIMQDLVKKEIVGIEFCYPLPLLITASSLGVITLWSLPPLSISGANVLLILTPTRGEESNGSFDLRPNDIACSLAVSVLPDVTELPSLFPEQPLACPTDMPVSTSAALERNQETYSKRPPSSESSTSDQVPAWGMNNNPQSRAGTPSRPIHSRTGTPAAQTPETPQRIRIRIAIGCESGRVLVADVSSGQLSNLGVIPLKVNRRKQLARAQKAKGSRRIVRREVGQRDLVKEMRGKRLRRQSSRINMSPIMHDQLNVSVFWDVNPKSAITDLCFVENVSDGAKGSRFVLTGTNVGAACLHDCETGRHAGVLDPNLLYLEGTVGTTAVAQQAQLLAAAQLDTESVGNWNAMNMIDSSVAKTTNEGGINLNSEEKIKSKGPPATTGTATTATTGASPPTEVATIAAATTAKTTTAKTTTPTQAQGKYETASNHDNMVHGVKARPATVPGPITNSSNMQRDSTIQRPETADAVRANHNAAPKWNLPWVHAQDEVDSNNPDIEVKQVIQMVESALQTYNQRQRSSLAHIMKRATTVPSQIGVPLRRKPNYSKAMFKQQPSYKNVKSALSALNAPAVGKKPNKPTTNMDSFPPALNLDRETARSDSQMPLNSTRNNQQQWKSETSLFLTSVPGANNSNTSGMSSPQNSLRSHRSTMAGPLHNSLNNNNNNNNNKNNSDNDDDEDEDEGMKGPHDRSGDGDTVSEGMLAAEYFSSDDFELGTERQRPRTTGRSARIQRQDIRPIRPHKLASLGDFSSVANKQANNRRAALIKYGNAQKKKRQLKHHHGRVRERFLTSTKEKKKREETSEPIQELRPSVSSGMLDVVGKGNKGFNPGQRPATTNPGKTRKARYGGLIKVDQLGENLPRAVLSMSRLGRNLEGAV